MKIKVHCFGKLPVYADFITYECTGELGFSYKKWMDAGFIGDADGYKGFPPGRFFVLYGMEKQGETLLGILRDSQDLSGRRRFPFSIFLTFPSKVFQKTEKKISALSLEDLREKMVDLDGRIDRIDDLKNIFHTLGSFELNKNDLVNAEGTLEKAHEFPYPLTRLVESLKDGNTTLNHLIWGIRQISLLEDAWLKTGGIRWPLAPGFKPAFQIDLWMRLFENQRRHMGLAPVPRFYSILYPEVVDSERKTATVLFRDLRPEDTALFLSDSIVLEGIVDLSGNQSLFSLDGFFTFNETIDTLLEDHTLTVADLLKIGMDAKGNIIFQTT